MTEQNDTSPVTIKVETTPILWGLLTIAMAIMGPVQCAHGARCAKWVDRASSAVDRTERLAHCEAEEAAR